MIFRPTETTPLIPGVGPEPSQVGASTQRGGPTQRGPLTVQTAQTAQTAQVQQQLQRMQIQQQSSQPIIQRVGSDSPPGNGNGASIRGRGGYKGGYFDPDLVNLKPQWLENKTGPNPKPVMLLSNYFR